MPPPARLLRAVVVLATALVLAPLGGGSAAAAPAADPVAGPVVLVGAPGLRWDDVSEQATPSLWSMLVDGSVGTLAVRSVRTAACPIDGWLAVSAGRRAADAPTAGGCRPLLDPRRGELAAWPRYLDQAASASFDAQPGLLGDALRRAGTSAVAAGPGAAIALADSGGRVAGEYVPHPASLEAFGDHLAAAFATDPDLVVVDAGAVRDRDDLPPMDRDRAAGERASQVARIDHAVGLVLERAGANATVLVASIADSGRTPRLGLLAATGPAGAGDTFAGGLLGSSSTRQDGLAQTTDLTPTVLSLLGIDAPSGLVGSPVRPLATPDLTDAERYRTVLDLDASAAAVKRLIPPFFLGLVFAEILLYGLAALALRVQWGGPEGRRPVLRWMRRLAIVFAAVPVSTFLANLVPWWRAGNDLVAVVAAVAVGVALVTAAATVGPWRDRRLGPFGAVAGITAGVLAVDVATGSHLQLSSLMGQQPLVGGRFYGLGNQQFALFATGALLLSTALADAALRAGRRRLAVAVVVTIGVLAVVIDGTPGIGSDFGGPPAMVPAFAVLALLVAGVRLSARRLTGVAVGTLAVVVGLSLFDWTRPPAERTHLGRFVDTVIDGGAIPVIQRKLEQNWNILTGSELSLLVPFGAVFVGLVLMRPVAWGAPALQRTYEFAPILRHGLVALLVMLGIGFAVNDSGTVVPAIGGVLAIPLLIAASVRTLELADAEPGEDAAEASKPPPRPATPARRG